MRHIVLGTAGHIDHGKTALVRALTGTDTDRLPEEKRRGITIDLGFARLPLDGATDLAIVDVPGHEAFVRNMLAGASGIDLAMLVVAADEGVMPQTREHLAIIELLGITRGVIAITKADLVEDEWLELVRDEVRELTASGTLAAAPVLAVSARTGAGLEQLTAALRAAAADVPRRATADHVRMPIDRVFSVRGTGTVVTGTIWSGSIARDEQVLIEPAGLTARVRTLQQHGTECDRVSAGARAAIALAGVDRAALTRGDCLLAGTGWSAASILTLELRLLPDAAAPLRTRQRVRLHLGTAEVLGRIGMLPDELAPGAAALIQLRLEQPVVARAGDRVVVRSYSPVHTIAGGLVLEPAAPKRKRLTPALSRALHLLREPDTALDGSLELHGAAGPALTDLPLLTGLPADRIAAQLADRQDLVLIDGAVLRRSALQHCRARILTQLQQHHAARPLEDGPEREAVRRSLDADAVLVFEPALAALLAAGDVVTAGSCLALASHVPAPAPALGPVLQQLRAVFEQAGLQAPDIAELPPPLQAVPELTLLLRHLERAGYLVRLTPTRWCLADAVTDAARALRAALPPDEPQPVGTYKELLSLTRKHLIPLLEFWDRTGFTTREGDGRSLATAASAPESLDAPDYAPYHG